jgi:DNA-binding SARP family transcriptional activator/tetratricopeptide (TPR) repeat protein
MPIAAAEHPVLRVQLVGTFDVTCDAEPVAANVLGSRKARSLLKLLATQRRRIVTVERIVEVLWGAAAPERPAENVATLVSRLRRSLGPGVIDGGRDGYRLGVDVHVDLDDAARWLAEAERRLIAGEGALALAAATRASDTVAAQTVLDDEADAEWAEPARGELADLVGRSRHVLAEAALATGEHQLARTAAEAAIAADPFDEAACRALMRAHRGAGQPARALVAYAQLRDRLAAELGADPAPETQTLHLDVLREQDSRATPRRGTPDSGTESLGLVGRGEELRRLRDAWNEAADRQPRLVVVAGEAGIGKTRLCDELGQIASTTGGTVLAARCYETERSLFLQPIVDALSSAVRVLPPAALRELASDHASALAALVPDVAAVLGIGLPAERGSAEIERRRAFEAVTAFVRALADRGPVLLSLDDLQNAGLACVELVHFLIRQARTSRLLVVATVRAEEGAHVIDQLAGVADRLDLGPLPAQAVERLAAAAGQAGMADVILRQTRGHALFVVETLRALASGNSAIPSSLEAAVLARVRRAGKPVEELVRAASVLGASFDPAVVADLMQHAPQDVIARCEDALAARLLVVAGRDYEFANDLVREVLCATTPAPTRLAYHRRAADLLTQRPEAMAAHASAADDWPRAARAWLLAGEQALARAAADDAAALLTRALDASALAGDLEVRARALLARARALEARTAYHEAIADMEEAVSTAHAIGDQRLEMVALRALGGDAQVALGRPADHATMHIHRGLRIATSIGDRAMEADLLARLAIMASNGLAFDESVEYGRRAVAAARASGDEKALAAALDGRKTSLAYIGEVADLGAVLDELGPLLRRQGDLFRLHWLLFESGLPAVAAGDWASAKDCFEQALDVNRRSGFPVFASWHVAHLGWLARLQGDYHTARALGQQAVALDEQMRHAWGGAMSASILGTTMLETGATADAIALFEFGRQLAEQDGAEAYLLRCLAPLAEATRSRAVLAEADAMLARVTVPAGSAWLTGDGAYIAVARAWLAHGEPDRARSVLAPMLAAAHRVPWVAPLAEGSLVDGLAAGVLGRAGEARVLLVRAAELAQRHHLPYVAQQAAEALR